MLNRDQLVKMSQVDIAAIDKNCLVDMQSVTIDPNQSLEERIAQFLEQAKNPYIFRCGEIAVRITFKQNGPSLEHLLQTHFTIHKE